MPKNSTIPTQQTMSSMRVFKTTGKHWSIPFKGTRDQLDYSVTKVGNTAHVTILSAVPLGNNGWMIGEGMLRHVEDDFLHIEKLFGVPLPAMNIVLAPLSPNSNGTGGAYHYGCGVVDLYCDVQFNPNNIWTSLALFVAEAVEVASATQNLGWDCGATNGEAISRVIAERIHPVVLDGYSTASSWLNSSRPNWIDQNENTDQDDVSNGCGVLFLNWLHDIKGFSFTQICQAAGATLAATYQTLSGKTTAWTDFTSDVDSRWPVGHPSGVMSDAPWVHINTIDS
jgi:hypothetical protein